MPILVDTNVLLRAVQRKHPVYPIAVSALKILHRRAEILCLMPQNLIEFWNVCTRPAAANGLGLDVAAAERYVSRFERIFPILPDSMLIFREWRVIVTQYSIIGVSVHDARLVAAMRVHAISRILTFDKDDFSRYREIEALDPKTL